MKLPRPAENLRKALWERIDEGELTGLRLARETGFEAGPHFQLPQPQTGSQRRGHGQGIERPAPVGPRPARSRRDQQTRQHHPSQRRPVRKCPPGRGAVAARQPLIMSMKVKDILKFKKSFCAACAPKWKATARLGALCDPHTRRRPRRHEHVSPPAARRHRPDCRHYNSLKPYGKGESNMYAVARDGGCTGNMWRLPAIILVVRPHNQAYPVEVMAMEPARRSMTT